MDTPKFVADVHLARLARTLRLLGIDTLYFNHIEDSELKEIAKNEKRFILTKDRRLCEESDRCYLVQSKEPKAQLLEVLRAFQIRRCRPFSRCLLDNAPLASVSKSNVEDRLPPKVRGFYEEFWICPECDRVYWHGTHWERMRDFIDEVCDEIQGPGNAKS